MIEYTKFTFITTPSIPANLFCSNLIFNNFSFNQYPYVEWTWLCREYSDIDYGEEDSSMAMFNKDLEEA